jgi:hypothetical protein
MFSSIHLIGLGGTGANVIQSLVESERLLQMLSSEDFRIACLAIDVADGDLASLQSSYRDTLANLESKGVSVDRLWVKGLNIKFNTPDALFEFMEKYDTYLMKEDIAVNNYRPWIQSSMSIPPLAGGVGRQRALSKAVYGLNYYHYVELNSVMAVFKDRVFTSKYQPIVVIIFGLGGGTGSGMIFDFTRHLRAKLGSAVPIVGIGILPSSADDLLARGPAPYNTLIEAELLFNKEMNDKVVKNFGEAYRNPFTALCFLALDPVYNNRNSLMNAKKELDEALIDIIHLLMNFDLADMLSRIGTNNDFGPNWVHALDYLRIRYPVEEYVKYLHEYLQLAESIGEFMNHKKEVLLKINELLKHRYSELVELYRRHLISINSYRSDAFEREVEDTIRRAGKYDVDIRKQMKGIEDFASYYDDKWSKVLQAMMFAEDTVEYAVMQRVNRWREEISRLSRTQEDFAAALPISLAELENSITASKFLTSNQIRQIRSYINLVTLVGTAAETFEIYLRAKALADELAIRYAKDQSKEGRRAVTIGETELIPIFKAAGAILTRPETEVKMSEQYLPGIRVIKNNLESRFKEASSETESIQRLLAQKEAEENRLKTELRRIRIDLSGKKKIIQRSLEALQSEMASLQARLAQRKNEDDGLRSELEKLTELEKSLWTTSQYRRMLSKIVNKSSELNTMISMITGTSSYYERVVELSEAEQIKIMEKILREEESSLKGEGILREIVDRDRFRDMVKSCMRIFSLSNYAGLADSYRSDLIWATIGIPPGLWDQELQGMLSSTLNVFSSVEASKSISIRQIPQVDPWTITFLIILAKARADQIEKFSAMKNDAEGVRRSEKVMFRSFLLEHGAKDLNELVVQLEAASRIKIERREQV